MDTTDIRPVTAPAGAPALDLTPSASEQCLECAAPVEPAQRYCVVCGVHRSHVEDPATRYLQRAGRRRELVVSSSSVPTPVAGRGSSGGLGLAVALALIPAAAAAGVLAGRSSNSSDASLVQALAHRPAATVTVATGAAPAAASAAAAASPVPARASRRRAHHAVTGPAPAAAGTAVVARTRYGTVNQVTGFKPTKAAEQQGAQATQQVQRSKGRAYVSSQDNLPAQVVVP